MAEVNNTFQDCVAEYENTKCQRIFIVIISTQTVISITSLSLNLIIVRSFYRKPSLRRKNPSILLFNQAIGDLVNMIAYLLPNTVHMLYQVINHRVSLNFYKMNIGFLYLTLVSSMALFAVISIERFLSIYKPLWSKIYVQKRHLWRAVCLAWSVALFLVVGSTVIWFETSAPFKNDPK